MSPDTATLLDRFGLEPEPPSPDALRRLHRAWLEHVPYETVWIHQGDQWGIDPVESLHRIADRRRGGYCFQVNGALSLVLAQLGYRVSRHVGGVNGPEGPSADAMTNHLVLLVSGLASDRQPDGWWYVDAGLGDALRDPLPLAPGRHHHEPLTFELAATDDGVGDWHLLHDPAGSFTGMSFRSEQATMDAFAERHRFLSTSPDSHFVAGPVTATLRPERETTVLRGCVLTRLTVAGVATETFEQRDAWFGVLADGFGIVPAGSPASLDGLWRRVATAHESWLASTGTA